VEAMSTNERLTQQIELRVEGSRAYPGAIDLEALPGLASGLRRALRAVVLTRRGMPGSKPGPSDRETRFQSGIRLVDVREGSAVLVLEAAEPRLFEGGDQAVKELLDLVTGQAEVDQTVIAALDDACRALGDGGRMTFHTPWRAPVSIDKEVVGRLRSSHHIVAENVTVSGWLHGADIDPDHIVIRDSSGTEWTCHYAEDQERSVLSLIGSIVKAQGRGSSTGKRGRIEVSSVEEVSPPTPITDHRGADVSDLTARAMRKQGIDSPQSLAAHALALTQEEQAAFLAAMEELS